MELGGKADISTCRLWVSAAGRNTLREQADLQNSVE